MSNSNKVVTLDRYRIRLNFSSLSILRPKTLLKWGKLHYLSICAWLIKQLWNWWLYLINLKLLILEISLKIMQEWVQNKTKKIKNQNLIYRNLPVVVHGAIHTLFLIPLSCSLHNRTKIRQIHKKWSSLITRDYYSILNKSRKDNSMSKMIVKSISSRKI